MQILDAYNTIIVIWLAIIIMNNFTHFVIIYIRIDIKSLDMFQIIFELDLKQVDQSFCILS